MLTTLESPFSLGPMDHIVSSTLPIEAVFIYRKPQSSPADQFIALDRLKEAVSHVLDYYPHLTGRLQENPVTHAPEIGNMGKGMEVWEARCGKTLRHIASESLSGRIIMPKLPGSGAGLLPIFHSSVAAIPHNAIFAIQHTRFSCGGVSLGIRIHHQVCDAKGFFQAIRDLAELYRQLRDSAPATLISPPEIRSKYRDYSDFSPNGKKKALAFKPVEFCIRDEGEEVNMETKKPNTSSISARVLRFSSEDLVALKAAATNPDPNSGTWVSTFEALSAYLYQRIYQAKVQAMETYDISPNEAQSRSLRGFWTALDMRSADRLALAPRYFPNAVHCVSTYVSHENLLKGHRWYIANAIHYAIRSVDNEHVQQQYEWIGSQPDQSRVRPTDGFGHDALFISQWTRDNTYLDVDFEIRENGRPVAPSLVSPPLSGGYMVDGLATVISTEEVTRRGSNREARPDPNAPYAVYVNLVLNNLIWPFLQQDPNFLKYIS